jgi:hypothetical protein
MRKTIFNRVLTAFLAIASFTACKKDGSSDNPPKPTAAPVKTAKGTPVGDAVSKTIGSSGGTLTSGDGKLTITVPAGAVSSNTAFSIQPISNTLPGKEDRPSYRLLPEGNNFAKRISVQYRYSDDDTRFSNADLLSACYQTSEGTWKAVATSLNKSAKTLTLTTDHFSDWTVHEMLSLHLSKKSVTVHDVADIDVTGFEINDEALLAPAFSVVSGSLNWVGNWEVVNRKGTITADANNMLNATYRPPSPLTHGDTAVIQVVLKGNILIPDSTAPGNKRVFHEMLLIAAIPLLNDNFMQGSFNGFPILSSDAAVYGNAGQIMIIASMSNDSSVVNYSLIVKGVSASGTYPCGDPLLPGNANVTVIGNVGQQPINYNSGYIACGPPVVQKYSNASVKIDNWGPIGTYITGSFEGPLYKVPDQCSPPGRGLSVKFHARRIL